MLPRAVQFRVGLATSGAAQRNGGCGTLRSAAVILVLFCGVRRLRGVVRHGIKKYPPPVDFLWQKSCVSRPFFPMEGTNYDQSLIVILKT